MFIGVNELIGYRFEFDDEVIGKCADVLFDDRKWQVRYLVVDSPDVAEGHQRLVPVRFVKRLDHDLRSLHLKPAFNESHLELMDRPPVWLQNFITIFDRYGMSKEWIEGALAAHLPKPVVIAGNDASEAEKRSRSNHLRSIAEVSAYVVEEGDAQRGHITDFTMDGSWFIQAIQVEFRRSLLFDVEVASIPPSAVSTIEWAKSRFTLRGSWAAGKTSVTPPSTAYVICHSTPSPCQDHSYAPLLLVPCDR